MSEVDELLQDAKQVYETDDIHLAVERFTVLAERDVIEACHFLGFIYKTESGEFSDPDRSAFWYSKYLVLLRRAAEGGDMDAMLSLGKHYQYGDLVSVDETKAQALMERAASFRHADAQFHLAILRLHGWCGYRKDEDAHLEWLDRAAAAQHPEALFKKGQYLIGARDAETEGLALIRQSADLGFWMAKEYLERRTPDMIPAVEEFFFAIRGAKCWSVIAGAGTGSIVNLGFGAKAQRKRPLQNQTLPEEDRVFEAERSLIVYCDWRFETSDRILCSSQSAGVVSGAHLPAITDIRNRAVKNIEFSSPRHDLRIEFDNGVIFSVFCNLDPVDECDSNYVMFNPTTIVAVTPQGNLAVESRNRK